MSLEEVAFHEAGHVVACIALGMPVSGVTLVDDKNGVVEGARVGNSQGRVEAFAKVCLAGEAAERIAFLSEGSLGSTQDYADALAALKQAFPGQALVDLQIKSYFSDMVVFLTNPVHWRAVEAVANELLEKRNLSGEEARAVMASSTEQALEEDLSDLQQRLLEVREKILVSVSPGIKNPS